MIPIEGKGESAVIVMWVLTSIGIFDVVIRLYTRKTVIRQLGYDDVIYTLSGVFLVLYTLFTTISAAYGFGHNVMTLDPDDAANAMFWELVGQTFICLGMATAKVSLGIFLLRIVVQTWHRVAIYTACSGLMAISLVVVVLIWTQSVPVHSVWDPRVPGHRIDITAWSLALGIACAVTDFFFAAFPWLFIWGLNMKYREKVTIAGSMSLGVIAGICGSIRSSKILKLSSTNYIEDTVPLIVWSAAELAVTLTCIVIPILRPLYRKIRHGSRAGKTSSNHYFKYAHGTDWIPGASGHGLESLRSQNHHHNNFASCVGGGGGSDRDLGDLESAKLESSACVQSPPQTQTTSGRRKSSKLGGLTGVSAYCARGRGDGNASDDEILAEFGRCGNRTKPPVFDTPGITVTEDVTVEVGSKIGSTRSSRESP